MLFAVCGLFLLLSFFIKSFGAWIYSLQVCCCSCITSCSSGPRFSTPPVFQLSQGMSEPYILYLHLYDCIGSLVPFKCAQTLKNTDCGPSLIEERLCVCVHACACIHCYLGQSLPRSFHHGRCTCTRGNTHTHTHRNAHNTHTHTHTHTNLEKCVLEGG